jgi:hypothetical protein
MKKISVILFILFFTACARIGENDGCDQANPPSFTYGPPTYTDFQLSSYRPGDNAVHTVTFDITACHLETYQVVIKYPGSFTWNGFLALGSAGTLIGTYNLDELPYDGEFDYTIHIHSSGETSAYAARWAQGDPQTSDDATIVYTYDSGNDKHVLTTTIPKGGDYLAETIAGPFTERLVAIMNAGLFTNPSDTGTYTITVDLTSVDPDTDGAAGGGETNVPQTLNYTEDIKIKGSANPGVLMNLLE